MSVPSFSSRRGSRQFRRSILAIAIPLLVLVLVSIGMTDGALRNSQLAASTTVLLGSTNVQANPDTDAAGMAEAFRYTAADSGMVSSISFYIDSGSKATSVVVGLYADRHHNPARLLTEGTITGPTPGAWHSVAVSSAKVTRGSHYWLALLGVGGQVNFRDVASGGRSQNSAQTALGSLPRRWSSGARWANSPASLFASSGTVSFPSPAPSGEPTAASLPAPAPTQPPTLAPTSTQPFRPTLTPTSTPTPTTSPSPPPAPGNAPSSPPVTWCETGPPTSLYSSAPAGAVVVPAGDNFSQLGLNWDLSPNTTYWFAPGTHILEPGQFNQIQPQDGDTFLGAPGAVLDGEGSNAYAFTGNATGVTIKYLTIQNFVAPQDQLDVNHNEAANWTIEYSVIQNNGGGGVGAGDNNVISDNCLKHNDQYGFQTGGSNILLTNNDMADNDYATYDMAGSPVSCGCSGAGKFWASTNVTFTGNYVHDNGGPGAVWADTDDAGFNISGNYISNSYAAAIIYEISYNFSITNNTFVGNAVRTGPGSDGGFPNAAVYISQSGSDPRVNTPYNQQSMISGNVFINNWAGVDLYENADRACGLSNDNACTLIDPSVYNLSSCAAHLPTARPGQSPDYYNNCRWKTQNVSVTNNRFSYSASTLGAACTVSSGCGDNALFASGGSFSPYQGYSIPQAITWYQNNHFANNQYSGSWNFVAWYQGNKTTASQWTTASPSDLCQASITNNTGSCPGGFGQDSGSTFTP